ncbi:MAG: hypothetical protein IJX63_07615 [Lachnospiraceae bacterium]|nr:hypothetical protein [Lachnospiraceae bacterium]
MMKYEKPIIQINSETAEGVYAASGSYVTYGEYGCNSKYMQGEFHSPNYEWYITMLEHYGCSGCPAYTYPGGECGLKTHFTEAGYAQSYDANAGKYKPAWELHGQLPDEIVDTEREAQDHGNP